MRGGKEKITFVDVARKVERLKKLKAPRTKKSATWQLKRLVKNFGEIPVVKIDEELWTEYLIREIEKRPRKFFDDRKHMLMVLNYARKKKIISDVPALLIPDLPWEAGREIEAEELIRLESNANDTLRFQIRIGWKMGLRRSEMLGLRVDQLDRKRGSLRLSAHNTKTRRSREVPIPTDLLGEFIGRANDANTDFFFPSPVDSSRHQLDNKTAWVSCKAKSKVRARWHDLRHTCATLLLRRGVSPRTVSRYLGMSTRVLTRIYDHLNLDDLRQAAEAMSTHVGNLAKPSLTVTTTQRHYASLRGAR